MPFEKLTIERHERVAWVTIDNPPVNVMTRELFIDLVKASSELGEDDEISVVVLQSANPDFFIAHFDVELLVGAPLSSSPEPPSELNLFDQMCERFRTMPKVTICKIAGRVGGGGSELAMACDMRFGALERAVMNQMEVPIGIIPGGGGTQRLPRLIGWNRAAEIIFGGIDLDAETGERWGYFNRALPADALDDHVGALAARIASFSPDALRHAKAAMLEGQAPLESGLMNETHHFDQLMAQPESRALMQRFLDLGGQTAAGEMDVAALSAHTAASMREQS